jgi:ferredoxin-NADP reductase
MKARLVKKVKRAENIASYFFSVDLVPKYSAGQYIELTIKHDNPDDRGQKRWFTVSIPPNDEYLSITTRYIPGSSSSFKIALNKLGPDDIVNISAPMGDFVLPIDQSIPLLFVAGGIGITPYLSILGYLLETREPRTISLLYSVKSKAEAINLDDYQDLLTNYKLLVTGESSRLTSETILEEAGKLKNPLIYISGPEKMVEVLGKEIVASGIDSSKVVGDYFPGYDT